ncbi:MAG: hypothetical protein P1V36_18245, partial [Planctomycetota bacterium]|nr:hypothetical protein [Planctomycetota bacterium]
MLPSPLGLLEYDVLEDAVFLGPGRKGGLRASPTPFKGAQVALKRGPDGFVARPLPGEAAPEINGEVVAERVLEDGDRIRLGEPVAMFRTGRGRVEAKPAPATEAPAPRPPRVERREAPRRQNPTAAIVMFTGLILLLAAAYRAANHMKALQSARSAGDNLPELEAYQPQEPGRIAVELAELNEEVLVNPRQFQAALENFRAFQRRHVGTVEAEIAGERVREHMAAWSADERKALNTHVEKLIAAQQYARALTAINKFESRFGTTEAAADLDSLGNRVRAEADATLEKLISKVSPLIRRQPREAHRMLISVSHQFPPDQASRVVHLVERCVQRMLETGPQRQPPRNGGPREPAKGPAPVAPKKAEPERGPPQPVPPPKGDDRQREVQCADAWRVARAHLLRADYAEALQAYTLVQQQYGNTALYREHKAKIAAGRRAARAGALGPQALVNVPVEVKKGRLEMEYHFNDQRVFEDDWTLEQPFSSAMRVQGTWKRGEVTLEKATGMLHRLVFLPDVRIEATATVHQPHDFGLLAVEESDEFRAVLFNIANTMFKLKKGDAARANKGHVLWYIGQGVWKDADKDAHGFIKIAERSKVSLESGDRIQLELTRTANAAEGTLQGKTDGVNLKG